MFKFDFDCVVIGSGFGGAVAALRSVEEGKKTLILEQGKRFNDDEFALSNWDLKRFMWAPLFNFLGPCRLSFTKKFMSISGVGVGGGSLIYANTHRTPDKTVLEAAPWQLSHQNWFEELAPFYQKASQMLGVVPNPRLTPADNYLHQVSEAIGCESTFTPVDCGVVFPEHNGVEDVFNSKDVDDPYFNGEGPKRSSCNYCGNCMVGCRYNAKNTLEKNYLFFAEKKGAQIRPLSKVVAITPLNNLGEAHSNGDGAQGYQVKVEERQGWLKKRTYYVTVKSIILSGGTVGSVPLLIKMRESGLMPNISSRIGHQVMTNSETLVTVTNFANREEDHSKGVAIGSEIQVNAETRVQVVRYGKGSNAAWLMAPNVPLTDKVDGRKRWQTFMTYSFRHPLKLLRLLNPANRSNKSIWLLVMQSKLAYFRIESARPWYFLFLKKHWTLSLNSSDSNHDGYFPVAQEVAKYFSVAMKGEPANLLPEVLFDMPVTAHSMGGAVMGSSSHNGVVDHAGNLFGYENFKVLDASIIPGNLGVNPSLTILAMAERAMSR
ncbi:hypothetical protein A3K86_02650 [Photobacterium jeanii]|uniref:Cholesterol oxidase n=1 Tax=Photobacterium jeanii TaxID=858640 RepID=A0A178KKQ3_9GAMM|nr:GMC oxidoreductase [Photobacterium jeanii]OAN17837.1 hypothetical protein A3K86_02650 [Photobacterium jeanii]PST92497.1 GMC family oxidoreductase [Photobacterium jeanii]